jgi:cell wall-associated NlpC family hydrolase
VPNIEDAVQYALAQQGKPYRNALGRFGPAFFDCSGLVVAALEHAGFPMPRAVARPNGTSVSLLQWGLSTGNRITPEVAIRTRGALLIRGGLSGFGSRGHVCFSLGDGRTMEAMGTAYGCRIGHAAGRGFGDGVIVPGASGPVSAPGAKGAELNKEETDRLARVEMYAAGAYQEGSKAEQPLREVHLMCIGHAQVLERVEATLKALGDRIDKLDAAAAVQEPTRTFVSTPLAAGDIQA